MKTTAPNGLKGVLERLIEAAEARNFNTHLELETLPAKERETVRLLVKALNKYQAAVEFDIMKYQLTSDALGIAHWDMVIKADDPVNPQNEFTWSQEFRRMLGFSDENDFPNLLSSWSDRLHPEDRDRALHAFAAHINDRTGKTPYDLEYRLMTKNGGYRHFREFGATMRDSEGTPLRVAGAFEDITDKILMQKRKREAEERLQLMLDATPLGCELWNSDLNIIDCNEETVRFFGVENKQVILDGIFDFSPEYQPDGRRSDEKASMYTQKAFEEGHCVFEWTHRLLDGTIIPTEVTLIRVEYEGDHIVAAYTRDLREQMAITARLEQKKSLLEIRHKTASALLSLNEEDSFEALLLESLGLIGHCLEADSVQIWQNEMYNGSLHFALRHVWLSDIGRQASPVSIGMKAPYTARWKELFQRGGYLNGPLSELHQEDQDILTSHGLKSTATIPLFSKGEFWGLFCVDDCRRERAFSEAEIALLHSAGLMMLNGIHHNEQNARLKEAHGRTKVIMEASPIGTTLWDRNCNLLDCNEAYARLFKLKNVQEFLEHHQELSPEYQPDGWLSKDKISTMIQKAFASGACKFEWTHRTPDGTLIPCHVTMVRVVYGNDYVVAGYLRDLREQQAMMSEIARKDALLRVANQMAGILLESNPADFNDTIQRCLKMMGETVNADRASIWVNSVKDGRLYCTQIHEWLGNTESQINTDITKEIPYDDVIPGWEETLANGRCINSYVRDMPPAVQKQLSAQGITALCVTPIFVHEQFWGFMGLDHCYAGRILDEAELGILHSCGLMIANALQRNEMFLRIHAANDAKSTFLAHMSHEMQTPLNAIIGMTTIGKTTQDSERKDYALKNIENASTNLLHIINDVLDMAKIEADKLDLSHVEFNIERMLKAVISIAKCRTDEKKQTLLVHVDAKVPHFVISDDQHLSQVITNLLANASKFTPQHGTITVKVSLKHEENQVCTLRFEVADNGIGISPEQQKKLFQAFSQAESGISRTFGGTGLGLALSKRIVEMMGGNIWIESELGKGARFIFTIKVNRGKQHLLTLLSPGVKREDLHVMVVDDDTSMRKYFINVLEHINIKCSEAANASEALRLIEANGDYDLYFIDQCMDDIDGIELTKKIKAREKGKNSLVTMISGYWPSINSQEMQAAGVDKFVEKPVFASTIIERINECLDIESAHQEESFQEATRGQFEGKRLLLVEDVEINREIVTTLLSDTGVDIDEAENGLEALTMVEANPGRYDLVFMDLQMPKMDGLEATRQIRALPTEHAKKLPIVAMTANAFKEDVEKCHAAGMDDHLGKPLELDKMLVIMKKYLG